MTVDFKSAVVPNLDAVCSLAQALTHSLYQAIDNEDAPRKLDYMAVMLAGALAVRGVAELVVHKDGIDRDAVEAVLKAAFSSAGKSEVQVMKFKNKAELDAFIEAHKNGVH